MTEEMTTEIQIRPSKAKDEPTLWTMLMYAAHESSLSAVHVNADLVRYVAGWGRTGDVGVIAERAGMPVGAAWVRLWSEGDHGYGYVADEVPELAIAVTPENRGQGIGTALLKQLLQMAQGRFPAISLSTQSDNPARRLYERLGFIAVAGSEIVNRRGQYSLYMLRKFE